MIEKYESRRLRVQVRRVLMDVWDPIGVKGESGAESEYDGYIGTIFELLVSKAPDKAIEDYLYWATHIHMGLDARRADMRDTIEALRKIQFPVDSN